MSNYAICRTAKIKSMADLTRAIQHDTRERVPVNAEPNLALNDRIRTFKREKVENYGVYQNKCRKDAVRAVEWLLTASDMSNIDIDQWAKDNIDFVAKKMGGSQNIMLAELHLDESTPHLHIISVPEYNGKLNAKHYIGGTKYVMRELQNEYAESMSKYGLDRGEPVEQTKARHQKSNLKYLEKTLEEKKKEFNELVIRFDNKKNDYDDLMIKWNDNLKKWQSQNTIISDQEKQIDENKNKIISQEKYSAELVNKYNLATEAIKKIETQIDEKKNSLMSYENEYNSLKNEYEKIKKENEKRKEDDLPLYTRLKNINDLSDVSEKIEKLNDLYITKKYFSFDFEKIKKENIIPKKNIMLDSMISNMMQLVLSIDRAQQQPVRKIDNTLKL